MYRRELGGGEGVWGEENASGRIHKLGGSYAIGTLMLKFAKFRMLSSGSCAFIFSFELTLRVCVCVVTSDVLLFFYFFYFFIFIRNNGWDGVYRVFGNNYRIRGDRLVLVSTHHQNLFRIIL